MITVRIEKEGKNVANFRAAMRKIGASVDYEDEDTENIWYNVTSDDDDMLENAVSAITSAYTRY